MALLSALLDTDNQFHFDSSRGERITFTGDPDVYHVTIVDVPDGYSWDEGYEMYTAREYGEWVLHIRKD